ncbi:MAG: hypothetical protein A2Y45_07450 [Tenericutes bacterium GWC2_34_14]|nr:MAG: hypothetical protein A2Z84_02715 [Tenericutes bacterium GWA2_35_7]OHE29741.1 MAG: hypothetical protein A2Y45_07450 [Tenericutes bacterium GWC2_34_14]OHE34720.1 MAG: hypothetical protein A2012_01060 [Tenericutes bacterium GWE2_34_108]OHE37419.1 MAG: hypothetical protein A2Y46_01950 [Tenericutes bacterium GWF1_35_14]OHE39447.1 MAG: hypothetical protein A2Y44_00910 [Tenericutes bacterium GWF2_35_184]OHE44364.1 MAG: hypothetical protein A2221_04600 [Tenericutes bacterium RIFOXYA2_FULL_36_3
MRKLLYLLLATIFAISLTSCIPQEEEARLFQEQYDQYLIHDISNDTYFDQMINTLSNDTIPSIVVVNVLGKNALGQIQEVKMGTGYIYALYSSSAKVITASKLLEETKSYLTYSVEIVDFTNDIYTAEIIENNEALGLATLSFNVNVSQAKLKKLDLATYEPRVNEPLLMISNYQRSRNAMHLGLLETINAETDDYITTLTVDSNCLGAVILNMQHQVVGLVIDTLDDVPIILTIEDILFFFNLE